MILLPVFPDTDIALVLDCLPLTILKCFARLHMDSASSSLHIRAIWYALLKYDVLLKFRLDYE